MQRAPMKGPPMARLSLALYLVYLALAFGLRGAIPVDARSLGRVPDEDPPAMGVLQL